LGKLVRIGKGKNESYNINVSDPYPSLLLRIVVSPSRVENIVPGVCNARMTMQAKHVKEVAWQHREPSWV